MTTIVDLGSDHLPGFLSFSEPPEPEPLDDKFIKGAVDWNKFQEVFEDHFIP